MEAYLQVAQSPFLAVDSAELIYQGEKTERMESSPWASSVYKQADRQNS